MTTAERDLFESLPPYEGGTAVETVFNCGAGLAVETAAGSAEDSFLKCIDDTTAEEFLRFCAALAQSGLTLDNADDNDDLLCREYYDEKNRQIVYTGITRAKKRAVVVGGEKVLEIALSRRLARNTGLSLTKV